MKIVEFISYLQNLGIKVWIEQEQLGCDAPKGVMTPELKQDLIARKTEIIEFLRQGYKTQEQFIKQVSRDGKLPLSFAQERLWFLNQLFPNNPAYNVPIVLTIDGTLNVVALEQSLNAVIQRHETLRTTFFEIDGKPVQIVAPVTDLKLPVVDLQNNYSPQEQSEKVQQLIRQEAMTLFDLAKGPVLRVTLLRLDPERHVLLMTMHHIMCDLWSLGILVKELSSFYAGFSQGKFSNLPELPIQYADFAYWQREWFAGGVLEKQLNYWKKQLTGVSPVLKLPTDYPHPAKPTFKGGSKSFQINLDLTRKLRQLSKESESTLFMTLLSAFFVLLSRYSGQLDLVVGSPIANRNRGEIESLIGMFVNTLVLRADLSDNPTFQELLNQVRETTLEAYAHQDFPFEKLVEQLKIQRNLSHNPLVQIAIALQNTKMEPWNLPGLRVSQMLDSDFTRFDLEVQLMEVSSGLEVSCNYSRDIFESDTIDRMMKHFQVLLEAVVTHPEQRVLQLPLMTEVELDQILVEWNDTKTDYLKDKCIHQLFEEQVEKTPDAVAVIFEERQLTYFELNCRANQLAHYLQSLGVRPEVLVGICVERSVEMVIGLLGILKAGGAYVPLDPSYPAARLSYILEDATVPILVTTKSVLSDLPQHSAKVVCLDRDLETVPSSQESTVNEVRSQPTPRPSPSQEGNSEVRSCFGNGDLSNSPKTFHPSRGGFRPNYFDNPAIGVTPNNLAYVIYTSGSTGKPKGVLISHQNVTRLFKTTEAIYNFNAHDCSTLFHSYAFDFSVWELWSALLYGGRLVIVPYWVSRSPKEFYDLLVQHQVTVLNQTPSAFAQLIEVDQDYSVDALKLRYVIFGGEALQIKTLAPWFERHGDRSPQLINMYGITETTVHLTYQILSTDNIEQVSSPIGKALTDLKIYILDRYLQPVPIGVTGELHIGGAGLARGYLNRPELTAERFIPNPFEKNSKLYKTGDLARYLPDGNLEFIGRIDNQVKVRGYRIETGEIESTLTQNPSVKQTVVLAKEDNSGHKILVAYLVLESETPEGTQTEAIGKLKHYLKQRLPEYMIPSWFVVLPQLPLTPNGKVDRKALPVPNVASSVSTEYVAPQTQTQKALAEIWKEVLGIEKVGIHDNFFDLGGHSLMATQVVSRVRQTFNIELPLTKLFENSELVSLAQEIELYLAQSQNIETVVIQPRDKNENPPPLSHPQQRLWFIEKMDLSSNAYNQPLTLHLVGKVDYVALQTSINQIIARHETLRTTFSEINGTPVQIIKPPFELQLPIQDLSELTPSEQTVKLRQLLQQENEQTFNLEINPPIRAQLIKLETTEHILQITLHHIASDGWSLTVLFKELSAIYTAILENQPSPLPPLPIQYADFAVWQRNYLQGEILETQLNYWKQKLQDLPQLQLPTDHPRPPVQTFNGGGIPINISAAVTSKVKQLSQKQGTTLFMTLLAVFKVLLFRYSGQESIVVGTAIANRNRTEIEGLIGFFVNSLVMYTDLGGEPSFTEVLNRVKQTALEAYTHQDIPFEKLVEELDPQRSLSQNPLFQVMFALQQEEIFKPSFSLPNLEIGFGWERWMGDKMTVRMDMELHLWQAGDEIKGFCAYNRDLFEAETISRMLSHYQNLLSAAVETTEGPISQLPLMTEPELNQILVEWNDTKTDYPTDKCIHQLFEEQVEKTPDAVAVIFEGEHLTYQQLNCQANQLAHYLQSLGVKPEVLVGICVERSLEMVIGLLGILKAGGAYVPLDPSYPPAPLSYILEDAAVPILVTTKSVLSDLPQHSAQVVCLDSDLETVSLSQQSTNNPAITPENLAYVIYTSGSTGQPKGVLISHQNVTRLFRTTESIYNFNAHDCSTLFHSYAFDFSVWELWSALLYGGRLVIVPYWVSRSPKEFYDLLVQHQVTVLNQTPSAFTQLIEVDRGYSVDALKLRYIIFGGEALQIKTLAPWFERHGDRSPQLINMYGITETTVHVTYQILSRESIEQVSSPIGKALGDLKIYILDRYLQPVPIGVAGELHISGAGLARGYLNKPELTAERFIPNPFENNSKLYKTGDLGRYLPDGNIEYIGRIDNQVKVRGYRIETGEIEAVLTQHPSVKQTVVSAREDNSGNKILVAYLVLESETPEVSQTEEIGKLKQYLKERLPEYIIPSGFVVLPQLPLTPNGKVNRKTLPIPDNISSVSTEYVAPETETQKVLVEIWQEVLGIEKVGIYDNFFDLGGHSLTAVKLVSKISTNFNISLSVKTLFLHPIIADLSNIITELLNNKSVSQQPSYQSIQNEVQETLKEKVVQSKNSEYVQFESRSLLSLFAVGKIPPVDAVALGYLGEYDAEIFDYSRENIIENIFGNLPFWIMIKQTNWGRIAIIILPRFISDLYNNQDDTVQVIIEALEMARIIGAKFVSLTGLIPSATDYGLAINKAIANRQDLPKITTGHRTTGAAVVLTIKKICEEGGRDLSTEKVGFIGLGSVGMNVLPLMLKCLPHPQEITLCDVYSKWEFLENIQQYLVQKFGFKGQINLALSKTTVPEQIYDSTLIVGATNVADVLDIMQVKPGTLIVDDSSPHCFSVEKAIQRFQEREDILFSEGGMLRSPFPIKTTVYLPPSVEKIMNNAQRAAVFNSNPFNIMGCVFSSLLSSEFEQLEPTVGICDGEESQLHYQILQELEFEAGDLHCEHYVLPAKSIANFRQRFGFAYGKSYG
ncbi:MAG: amino acid adenylation domain-containing protein [Okeania sp. SIO2C2]|uniref:non-ribosomal peptide synthetase n=1 Tax=Okeania sp. SIO2C2 TaxID=2607787 RepID=UPI0013B8592E|nr:non-ribosomal peptide synthetase [Okeania sp. SIO2C2]NEP86223.1 amino acid adenylation domain-containing protein [Okeania sp. SIO2C2]